MNTQKTTYRNRYNDEITFEYVDETTIRMTGGNYLRYGYNLDSEGNKVITMVDPSGGPYIAVGSNLGLFWGDKIPRLIEKIEIGDGTVDFTLKV